MVRSDGAWTVPEPLWIVKLVVEALAEIVLAPPPRNSTSGKVAELVKVPEIVWLAVPEK